MCATRMQRLVTAIMLGIILYFFTLAAADFQAGLSQSNNFTIAVVLQIFVITMMLIWAMTNFCPSLWILRKILPQCKWDK